MLDNKYKAFLMMKKLYPELNNKLIGLMVK